MMNRVVIRQRDGAQGVARLVAKSPRARFAKIVPVLPASR